MILSKQYLEKCGNDKRVSQNTINMLARYLPHKTKQVRVRYFHGRWKVWAEAITPMEHFNIDDAMALAIGKVKTQSGTVREKIWFGLFEIVLIAKMKVNNVLSEKDFKEFIEQVINKEDCTVKDTETMLNDFITQKRNKYK